MGTTVGDPSVGSTYLPVALVIALFTVWIGKEILLSFLPAFWNGWHFPWDLFLECV